MTQTATSERARELVNDLLTSAARTEAISRRNGWDTATQSSVYPGGELIDSLLDIRVALTPDSGTSAAEIIDSALTEYGRRPGTCTTAEVRALCDRLLKVLTPAGATS